MITDEFATILSPMVSLNCPEVNTGGMASKSRLEAPFKRVKKAINNRKLPNLSAKKPAKGGPNISATGITEFTNDASSIV